MSSKKIYNRSYHGNDYQKGYLDGMQEAFENSELDAYYAGVGYGKMKSKDKHIGFNSAEEREQFEKGLANKDNHFKSYELRKSLFDRIFGIGKNNSRINVPRRTKKRFHKKRKKERDYVVVPIDTVKRGKRK